MKPTKTLSKINLVLGWTLTIGIPVALIIFAIVTSNMGHLAPLITIVVGGIFFPFLLTGISAAIPSQHSTVRWTLIVMAIAYLAIVPLGFPFFFDIESVYFSLIGITLTLVALLLKERGDIILLILNGLGTAIWLFISLVALLSK